MKGGEQQFLVGFVGFDDSENRWLAAAELVHARELLDGYKRAHGL